MAKGYASSDDGRMEYERQTARPGDIRFERVKSEEEDYDSSPPVFEINTYPADFTLEVLYQKWNAKDIEIPPFQRQFVWKQFQASKLIESFLSGLPVPAIYLYTERTTQRFLVIDGQQRLKSVFYYFDGFFGEEQKGKRAVFTLQGLNQGSKYSGKTFANLDDADQRKLHNCVLRSFIVQQLAPADNTSIHHIFERLNTGGTLLANQEIRNCVHRGAFNGLLHELNELPAWRIILGRPKPDSRQRDVELVLRFFSLLDLSHYEKPMKDFLSKFMKANREPSNKTQKQFRQLFAATCQAVVDKLGGRPFHIRAGLNVAVFDSVMATIAHHLQSLPADLKDRYDRLTKDAEFLKNVSAGTTDEEVVRARFEAAATILFGE